VRLKFVTKTLHEDDPTIARMAGRPGLRADALGRLFEVKYQVVDPLSGEVVDYVWPAIHSRFVMWYQHTTKLACEAIAGVFIAAYADCDGHMPQLTEASARKIKQKINHDRGPIEGGVEAQEFLV
jgi:hypothetical protein